MGTVIASREAAWQSPKLIIIIRSKRMEKTIAVYILTNEWNTVLYTGVTSDLTLRLAKHREKIDAESFTSRYHLKKLVYFETTNDIRAAIAREKQIKAGSRRKKVELVESINPTWQDLTQGFTTSQVAK